MPDDSPPAVARLPSSTNLAPRFRWIPGNWVANRTNAPWYVVAALPDKSPVFARTNAPVQTDMVTSVFFVDLRIQSSTAAVGSLWAGYNDDLRRRRVFNAVIRDTAHFAAGMER